MTELIYSTIYLYNSIFHFMSQLIDEDPNERENLWIGRGPNNSGQEWIYRTFSLYSRTWETPYVWA